ncbi:hypothetical protein BO71DRAFT_481235 [Aspergillus ellipticus CBS 707.79]|uniref:Uncharacterized protein n=1 Tax=Aspergillus ellipticus CBS 707.79 TaxID=1448320 RepID=A0A319DKQ3_9EURO|nr:hypothetical protein BO71DRAFT_481235 [Aspergillus ellipticus CBS 707.79]
MSLKPNALYIALFIRDDPPKPDGYHWALYYQDATSSTGILKTFLLVGLIHIAYVPPTTLAKATLDRVFRSYDEMLNQNETITCRTWVLDVLRRLQEQLGVLQGIDLQMLERETMDWGNRYRFEASRNVQPRPVVDPQSAVLTNIEVLAYVTANPPRRPPNPPPNSRHWVPSPDLRDHNTVVKEIHNYVTRLSPHILKYPQYTHQTPAQIQAQSQAQQQSTPPAIPPAQLNASTPLDHALRELVTRLQPFGLTKGEVLMIVNLGVGLQAPAAEGGDEAGEGEEDESGEQGDAEDANQMDVDGAEAGEDGREGEMAEDYGALALLDTVIEEREERLSNENVVNVLAIIRETLGSKRLSEGDMDEEG